MQFTSPPNQQAYYEQVWNRVRQIPKGKVAAYGQISLMLPPANGVVFEAYKAFGPIMGGMDRKGVIGTGTDEEIRRAVTDVLRAAPDRFILGADCTVPGDARWEGLRAAIATAHAFRRG